ncbi:hypothetical protein AMJ40_00330 [candidate division TA06 bacterium DG_26]|uniref:Putative regulatory protein FmdB zinc ribbon domain-containing protein n=1 Tax=candidate division TA06 bacterium DG_26 TaxID=1703771 RepID=A0A0S7WN13_UNCT6|nr:MAG: hypothetical protein AMJ40_00330 [candidate division TA06 bacterium DG_26]
MPIYEYRCSECGKVMEVFQKQSKPNETVVCPGCGSKKVERLISAPARVIMGNSHGESTCCGRTERCETPPCSTDGVCRRD